MSKRSNSDQNEISEKRRRVSECKVAKFTTTDSLQSRHASLWRQAARKQVLLWRRWLSRAEPGIAWLFQRRMDIGSHFGVCNSNCSTFTSVNFRPKIWLRSLKLASFSLSSHRLIFCGRNCIWRNMKAILILSEAGKKHSSERKLVCNSFHPKPTYIRQVCSIESFLTGQEFIQMSFTTLTIVPR